MTTMTLGPITVSRVTAETRVEVLQRLDDGAGARWSFGVKEGVPIVHELTLISDARNGVDTRTFRLLSPTRVWAATYHAMSKDQKDAMFPPGLE